jgi:glycosyl hydrolase family 9/cellulase-like Ig domain-containing protein
MFRACLLGSFAVLCLFNSSAQELLISDDNPLAMPPVGAHQLRIISPDLIELTLITTKKPEPASVTIWNFVGSGAKSHLPGEHEFSVTVDGKNEAIKSVGFKRRVLYAPLKERDLRIGNYLYLQLASPVTDGQTVTVANPDKKLWPAETHFSGKADPSRWSPAIHVNEVGYLPALPKHAIVGFYAGSFGETDFGSVTEFKIVEAASGKEVFTGKLVPRRDVGFPFQCYQSVLEADFSTFKTPGEYRLQISGLGTSYPFFIDDGVAAAFARTYALGVYHQRCGMANELPFTRFIHDACHVAPAEVPTMSAKFEFANQTLAGYAAAENKNPDQTAPPLKNVAASLYPFVNKGSIDVRGGHHDAGDYSKYTANSAWFIHYLVFAADNFPGAGDLDNLGLPESGDGKSDLLQEVKWEADFLAKMQDADGGFYFLVYPREREYEIDVLPDHGDPQIVYPKTTAATAAAVAALAQCASSPKFKQQFPEAAALYLEKAKKGWAFLERAIAKYGKDGAYQKITHYGDDSMHNDELAWAACEMYLATGDKKFEGKLAEWLKPADPETRLWGWWRMYACWGNAIRDYAFAARSGRLKRDQLNPSLLTDCENEITAAADDQLRRSRESAYATSFPSETKATRTAGWYFSGDAAFELAVACQLDFPQMNDPRPNYVEALLGNLNYEAGCNPVNVTYLTGLGWKRQRDIVDQYAENDRRVLPPSGIPIGNIQSGFGWMELYGKELGALSFPADSDEKAPYPIYDRWGDSFNLSQEFVIANQARALAYLSWMMGRSPLKNQPWKAAAGQITGVPARARSGEKISVSVAASGIDLSRARIVWEAREQEPMFGKTFSFAPQHSGPQWLEVEAQLPDGRRVFAVTNFVAK